MRRADRLFQLVQILRRGRVVTAAALADELEVSERTVYRDVADLIGNGVPIEGEAGVGYLLPASFDLPPLMFNREEIEALVLGARMVSTWADVALAAAAKSALVKVEQALPEDLRARIEASQIYAPDFHVPKESHAALAHVRAAIDASRILTFDYTSDSGERTHRRVRPIALFFWGRTWTMAAWCEMRADFRNFRVDRIEAPCVLAERFEIEVGRTLDDYLRAIRERVERERAPSRYPRTDDDAPKLPLSSVERGAIRAHGLRTAEIAQLGADALFRALEGAIAPERCAEIAALADFQQLASVGLETARDFVVLGLERIEDLVGRDPIEMYEELCRRTRARHDPCVEDVFRCAIAQAEDPRLSRTLGDWWHWTKLRGMPRSARPRAPSSREGDAPKRAKKPARR